MFGKYLGGVIAAFAVATLGVTAAHADTLRWSGEVDDTAIIRVSGRNVNSWGNFRGVRDSRFDIDDSLPNRPLHVQLVRESGRGDVEIVEQPSERNNYTAVVKVRDWQAGGSRYAFRLQWANPNNNDRRDNDRRNNKRDKWDKKRDRDNDWRRGDDRRDDDRRPW